MSTTLTRTVGLSRVGEIIRRRFAWIPIGAIIGALIGLLVVAPGQGPWTADTLVQIAPVTDDLLGDAREDSEVTEEAIAGSERTLSSAAERLGSPWDAAALRDALEVDKAADGAVVHLAVTGDNAAESARAADAIAQAYLEARTALAAERVAARSATLDARIAALQGEAPAATPERAQAITDALSELSVERAALPDPAAPSGTILTTAGSRPAWGTDRSRFVLVTTVAGAALGCLALGLAHLLARRPSGASDVAAAAGAPTWTPARGDMPWARPATLVRARTAGADLTVLTHPSNPGFDALVEELAEHQSVTVVDATAPDALAQVRTRHAVIAASPGWTRTDLARWAADLDAVGTELVGVALATGSPR